MSIGMKSSEESRPTVQQTAQSLVMPHERQSGWGVSGSKVVYVVECPNGKHYCFWGLILDHSLADLESLCVFIDNGQPNKAGVQINLRNPNLIKSDELEYLKDGRVALKWFEGEYAPHVIYRIHCLLRQPDLGWAEEKTRIMAEASSEIPIWNALKYWWNTHRRAHPLVAVADGQSRFWGR